MVEFSILNGCINGFTEKSGGVSKGSFESLNLGFNSGDDLENVEKNIEILLSNIEGDFPSVYYMDQIHGDHVHSVKDGAKGLNRIANTDGIITDQKNVLLMSTYADCVPILYYCKDKEVVALAHSGWKGTEKEIAKKMVEILKAEFDVCPEDLYVAIGPSAGICCYEVDSRVRDAFSGYEEYSEYVDENHVMLDLKGIVRKQLESSGVINIEVSDLCTICSEDRFFSYRRDGMTGRMVSFIGLKE